MFTIYMADILYTDFQIWKIQRTLKIIMTDHFVTSAYHYFCHPFNLPFANFVCLVPDHWGSGTRRAGAPAAPSIQSRTAYWRHVYGELKKGAGTPGARRRKWLPQRLLGFKRQNRQGGHWHYT